MVFNNYNNNNCNNKDKNNYKVYHLYIIKKSIKVIMKHHSKNQMIKVNYI